MTKKTKKPKTFNLKSFVIATLRRASYRHRPRTEALNRQRITRGIYQCEECKGSFPKKEIQLDHKTPVVPLDGWISFDSFIERLFCEADQYAVMCKPCHKTKTLCENAARKAIRKVKKDATET